MGKTIAMMVAVAALSACGGDESKTYEHGAPTKVPQRDFIIFNEYADSLFTVSVSVNGNPAYQIASNQRVDGGAEYRIKDAIALTAKSVVIYVDSVSVGQKQHFDPIALTLTGAGHVGCVYELDMATLNFMLTCGRYGG